MQDHREIVATDDGSSTIHSHRFQSTYHSIRGAVEETRIVFIQNGLQYCIDQGKNHLSILEMGMGTGLNALYTLCIANLQNININYHAVEAYPLSLDEMVGLSYKNNLLNLNVEQEFLSIHNAKPEAEILLSPNFAFTKYIGKIEDMAFDKKYHLIYYDAFAPSSQPELWSKERMASMYDILEKGGLLVTYCAKGDFKRTLKNVGFEVHSLPGPIGKREVVRAVK